MNDVILVASLQSLNNVDTNRIKLIEAIPKNNKKIAKSSASP